MGQLLHAIKAPSVHTTLVRDGQVMAIARDHFYDLLWNRHFLRSPVPYLEKRRDFLAILFALSTLPESIVSHRPDLPLAIEHNNVIHSSVDHFKWRQVLHKDWLVNKQLTGERCPCDVAEHLLFTRWCLFLDPVNIQFAVLSDNKHALASERDLLDFCVPGERCDFDKRLPDTIGNLFDLD